MSVLAGRVALVTGGGGGIGQAAALAFAAAGAQVVVADRDLAAATRVVDLLAAQGATALAVAVDVTVPAEVERMVATTIERFGGLDCALNNAGIEGKQASIVNCSLESWHEVLAVNLTGTFTCLKYELKAMLARRAGAIVNVSSTSGLLGFQCMAPYVASKHGIVGLTRAAALEVARSGIRVNAVCPSGVATPMLDRLTAGAPDVAKHWAQMHPMGRLATAHDVAAAAVWLCSDASAFVTGHALPLDGGLVIQ